MFSPNQWLQRTPLGADATGPLGGHRSPWLSARSRGPLTTPMPAFLAGCWEQRKEEQSWTEECWTDPRGGLMIGAPMVRTQHGSLINDSQEAN